MVMNTTLNTIPASIPYIQPEAKDVEEAKKLFPQEDNSLRVWNLSSKQFNTATASGL